MLRAVNDTSLSKKPLTLSRLDDWRYGWVRMRMERWMGEMCHAHHSKVPLFLTRRERRTWKNQE